MPTISELPIDMSNLFNGIAMIVDDELEQGNSSSICQIKEQLENRNIPLILKKEVPANAEEFAKHLYGISFIIMDWEFESIGNDEALSGVTLGSGIQEHNMQNVIAFIKAILKNTYCPLFIFSQQSVAAITARLNQEGVTKDDKHVRIFICAKDELKEDSLFDKISSWLCENPPIYVLKRWEDAARKAKLNMFENLEQKHPNWPLILWKTFVSDHSDPSSGLTQTLSNLLANRLTIGCDFDSSLLGKEQCGISCTDIRTVLEEERYINIPTDSKPAPGDLFKLIEGEKTYYWLNIRAQCNLLHVENPDLYCIRGEILDESRINSSQENSIRFYMGQLHNRDNIFVVPFVNGSKMIEFDFRKFKIKEYKNTFKSQRIGRLLPPFITRIQQLFSAYMIREGLPAIPATALTLNTSAEGNSSCGEQS